MKGAIVDAIKDLVVENFGLEKWMDVLENAGLARTTTFSVREDVPDETVLKLVESISQTLNLSLQEVADAFGEYWVSVYMPKVYKPYYRGVSSAKELLLKMDEVHRKATQNIPNAHPPRFEYRWEKPNVLIMKYKSPRGLMDIFIGLIKGVGKFYKTPLEVEQISQDEVRITFPE